VSENQAETAEEAETLEEEELKEAETEEAEEEAWEPPLFRLKADARVINDLFSLVGVANDEPTLNITADGVHARVMDPSRIYMVMLNAPSFAFEEYLARREGALTINLEHLRYFLKGVKPKDKVVLEVEEETGKLAVTTIGEYVYRGHIPVLEPIDEDLPALPKLPFTADAELVAKPLLGVLGRMSKFADEVCLTADEEGLKFESRGDLVAGEVSLRKGEDQVLRLEVEANPTKAKYNLEILTEFLKVAKTDLVKLRWGNDLPLSMGVQHPDMDVSMLLAPRVDME
jgi:hypothetical protein